jgi:hypothetical protein
MSFYCSLLTSTVSLGRKISGANTLAYLIHSYDTKKIKCLDRINNISFRLLHTNKPNRHECYLTRVWNGMPRANAAAY